MVIHRKFAVNGEEPFKVFFNDLSVAIFLKCGPFTSFKAIIMSVWNCEAPMCVVIASVLLQSFQAIKYIYNIVHYSAATFFIQNPL